MWTGSKSIPLSGTAWKLKGGQKSSEEGWWLGRLNGLKIKGHSSFSFQDYKHWNTPNSDSPGDFLSPLTQLLCPRALCWLVMAFIEHTPCVRHCSKHIYLITLYHNRLSRKQELWLSLFLFWLKYSWFVLVSAVQRSDSAWNTHIYSRFFPIISYYKILNIFPYAVCCCWC